MSTATRQHCRCSRCRHRFGSAANGSGNVPADPQPGPARRSQLGLDWLNFFLADVQTGFGPFVSVYLTTHGWKQGEVGSVLAINGALVIATQAPAGALIDRIRHKRLIVGLCLALIAGGALLIALDPAVLPVAAGEAMHGVTGGAIRTALAAIGLGLVGHRAYHTRVGRNQRYSSLGNAVTAAGMGALGALVSLRAPFYAAAALCIPALVALCLIRGEDIDYDRARSSGGHKDKSAAGWMQLVQNRRLLVFAGCLFLFQFASASMLPLATERLASGGRHKSELVAAALVAVPQIVTGVIAGWVARKADQWGRKRMMTAGFAALSARAALFAITSNAWYLVAVQVLGGITAAMVGIMAPLVVADVTRRSGRYNTALGATSMVGSVGATISTPGVGFVAQGPALLSRRPKSSAFTND